MRSASGLCLRLWCPRLWCFFLCLGAVLAALKLAADERALTVTALSVLARSAMTALRTGCACAAAESPPPAASAATANAGAVSAMASLVMTGRFSNRCEDNRELSAGHALRRTQLSPRSTAQPEPSRHSQGGGDPAFRRFKAKKLLNVTHRTRKVLSFFNDARTSRRWCMECRNADYEMGHTRSSRARDHCLAKLTPCGSAATTGPGNLKRSPNGSHRR